MSLRSFTLHDLIKRNARLYGSKTALVFGDQRVTHAQYAERTARQRVEANAWVRPVTDGKSLKMQSPSGDFSSSAMRLATELAAIREVLGPIERLKTARSARRETESHEETGGGGGGGEGRKAKTGWDALDSRQKAHYERMIAQGMYKDKKAVEEELKFARPRAR